ncbi:MAG: dioxygenase [Rhodocyclales bacterium]|nr:dioxygenase [Rhodocyclales bacterium]
MSALPALFVPHGAPTFALCPGAAGAALAGFAAELPRPRGLIVVSAHWDSTAPTLGAALRPETIHDFFGFPRELYALRYPAPGCPSLALDARNLLEDAGFPARLDLERGLDHGAWVPLRHLYPEAEVRVVPLSIQARRGPEHHYRLGRALAPLLRQDVLLVASGNLTHNLAHYGRRDTPGYVGAFATWVWERLAAGDADGLFDYRRSAPGAAEAHPSEEHLLPLFVALGAAGPEWAAQRIHTGIADGALAMDAFAFWPRLPSSPTSSPTTH